MLKVSRILMVLSLAAFFTTGTVVAQMQAPSMPPMGAQQKQPGTTAHKCGQTPKGCNKNQPKQQPGTTAHKCGQTPKGCHKNQPKSTGGAAPPPQL